MPVCKLGQQRRAMRKGHQDMKDDKRHIFQRLWKNGQKTLLSILPPLSRYVVFYPHQIGSLEIITRPLKM
jgi:hypothetical protein